MDLGIVYKKYTVIKQNSLLKRGSGSKLFPPSAGKRSGLRPFP